MKLIHIIAFILIVVGGLNWGLVGAFDFNLVTAILGEGAVTTVVYILVGLAAVWEAATHTKNCKVCGTKPAQPMM